MQTLIEQVKQWGHDKEILGIDGKGTLEGQAKKMIEEANETLVSVAKISMFKEMDELHDTPFYYRHYEDVNEAKDGIGDTIVTLILLAEMLETNVKVHTLLPASASDETGVKP